MSASPLHRLTERVYYLQADSRTDRPLLGVVVGDHGSLLVDAGNSGAHARLLASSLAEVGVAEPRYLLLTHWHWDHVFGAAFFDVPTIAHIETTRVLREMAQLDWRDDALDQRVAEGREIAFCRDMMKLELSEAERTALHLRVPDLAFAECIEVELGGVRCRIEHVGGDHASDASVVYVPEERVLFVGDCLYPAIYASPAYFSRARLLPLLERVLAYDADWYLYGHHPEPVTRHEFEQETELMRTISDLVTSLGANRVAVDEALQQLLGGLLNEDQLELVELFVAGMEAGDQLRG